VGGLQGALDHAEQVDADRVLVDGVLEPVREGGHGLVRVIPGPVEPMVNPLLDRPRYARIVPGTLPERADPAEDLLGAEGSGHPG
jgi:hypothetical protein